MRHLIFATALLILFASSVRAAADGAPTGNTVLKLFDLDLQKATRDQLRAAIRTAGGKLKTAPSANPSVDTFAVTTIGLPALISLEVVYRDGAFVLAAYHSEDRADAKSDERLRKMLAEKYGPPPGGKNFTDPFMGERKFTWSFANGMKVVYKKTFFDVVDLTYVDQTRFDAVKKDAAEADREDARAQARAKSNAF